MAGKEVRTALLEEAARVARSASRSRLITTNHNTDALRFYQRRGIEPHRIGRRQARLTGSLLAGLENPPAEAAARPVRPREHRPDAGRFGGRVDEEVLVEVVGLGEAVVLHDPRDQGIAVRGGCFCNPGCAERAFGFPDGRVRSCLDALGAEFTMPRFAACLDARRFAPAVETDVEQARAIGIRGTPTFIVNGRLVAGALSVEEFRRLIDEALKDKP